MGSRQCLHFRRDDHHLTDGSFAHALAAHVGFVPQRQVNDAPLAAVHRAEVERTSASSSRVSAAVSALMRSSSMRSMR